MSKHKDITLEDLGLDESELKTFAEGARKLFADEETAEEQAEETEEKLVSGLEKFPE